MPKALIAGAGGYLGQSVVRGLVGSGWEVVGMVRSATSLPRVSAAGGRGLVGDLLDAEGVRRAARSCQLLVHVAASTTEEAGRSGLSRRVRVEGCLNLLRAAQSEAVRRVVVGSGYWVYADQPGTITEESPVDPRGESRINFDTERVALEAAARGPTEVVVVRPGMVYGDGSWCRGVIDAVREGTYRYVGDGRNPWSFISLEDTGSAFARAAESGVSGELYNLVDGSPARWRDFGDFVAGRLHRPPPGTVSREEAARVMGPDVAHHLAAGRACSSAKLEHLGWRPRFRDFREGLPKLVRDLA